MSIISLLYNGISKNKIKIWSIKPFEDTKLIFGTLLRFKNSGMNLAAIKNKNF